MERVKGVPITQFCDERHPGTRERLAFPGDVFRKVEPVKPSACLSTIAGEERITLAKPRNPSRAAHASAAHCPPEELR